MSSIRTHDPSAWAGEDISCLWRHGHSDRRHSITRHNIELQVLSNNLRATAKLFYITSTFRTVATFVLADFQYWHRIRKLRVIIVYLCAALHIPSSPGSSLTVTKPKAKSSQIRHVVITDRNKLETAELKWLLIAYVQKLCLKHFLWCVTSGQGCRPLRHH
jgi:hypothetical protein